MPIVRFIPAQQSGASPTPTPTPPPTTALDVLSLEVAKRQLRITTDDADAIVTDAVTSAVHFVADAAGVTLAEIAESRTLIQACVVSMRAFFNGFEEIPANHAVWSLINAGAQC